MNKIPVLISFLLLTVIIFSTCKKKWDNPYDLNNQIKLNINIIPDTLYNYTEQAISWEVKTKDGKSVKDFQIKFSLFMDNDILLYELSECNSNDSLYSWDIDVVKTNKPYRIQIKSIVNNSIQSFSNEFIILE